MEFGRVSRTTDIQFDLPAIDTRPFLTNDSRAKDHRNKEFIIRPGAPTWSNPVWKGLIYPEESSRANFLNLYSQIYSTIEMNSTFHAIPRVETIAKWVSYTPHDFHFCPKVPKVISHNLGSREVRPLMIEFVSAIEHLDGRLGPLIFQLPPHFDWNHFSQLKTALELIPTSIKVAVEFRHPSWFFHNMLVPPVFHYLQSRGMSTVILDVPAHRELVHTSLTAPFLIVRWMGLNGIPSDSQRLHEWSARLAKISKSGLQSIYFFTHQESDELVPWSLAELGRSLLLHHQNVSRFWQPQAGERTNESKFRTSEQLSLEGI